MLQLFYFPAACSLAAMIGLEESGEPFTATFIDITGDRTDYLRISPEGKTPALAVGDQVLTENVAILYWLGQRHPHLFPQDAMAAAQILSLMSWFSSTVHITRRMASAPFRITPDKSAWPAIRESGAPRFWRQLQRIDGLLAGKNWFAGDQYTVCDGYGLLFYHWAAADKLPVGDLAHYTAFKDRMLARPAVVRALEKHDSPLLR